MLKIYGILTEIKVLRTGKFNRAGRASRKMILGTILT